MSGERKLRIELPILDEAVVALKETGRFEKDLTASEVADIMRGVVSSLVPDQGTVETSSPLIDVRIENGQGKVSSVVRLEKPIQATLGINCVLANDRIPGRLKLASLKVNQEAGILARTALRILNIEGRAREALRDPNQTLLEAISDQLEPEGLRITGIGLAFTRAGDHLKVLLTGKRTS